MSSENAHRPRRLTPEERKSLTHGDFWIPDDERVVYRRALEALNAAGIPFVVAGAYAIYEHTGIYRKTKDLDLFFEPAAVPAAARALRAAGFVTRLEDTHWLAKATIGEFFVDLIYGMGNGVARIDEGWIRHSRPGILAAAPVRIAPAEELIWHRLFINERHRHDMSDVVHLILCLGDTLDWERLVDADGRELAAAAGADPDVQLRLSRLPIQRAALGPRRAARTRARATQDARPEPIRTSRAGPLISRFSFSIDVREWGFVDPTLDLIRDARQEPADPRDRRRGRLGRARRGSIRSRRRSDCLNIDCVILSPGC